MCKYHEDFPITMKMRNKIKTLPPKQRRKRNCSRCGKQKALCWEYKCKLICWDCAEELGAK